MECLQCKNQSHKYTSIFVHCHSFLYNINQNRNLPKIIVRIRNLQMSEDPNDGKGVVSYGHKANGQRNILKKKQFYDFSFLLEETPGEKPVLEMIISICA